SDGEQPTREVDIILPADSSDFQINQFIPDYNSQPDEDNDDHADGGNRLSTSFDLQQLAGEVELESEVTVPGLKRSPKSTPEKKNEKKASRSKSGPQKTVDRSRTRQPVDEPEEEGSVISDSAMKTRKANRTRKSEPDSSQGKRSRPAAAGKKPSRPQPTKRSSGARKSVRETSPVMNGDADASESEISLDYRQIGLVLGGLLLVIILIWWAVSSMGSGSAPQQGPGSNPFDPNAEAPAPAESTAVAAADEPKADAEAEKETEQTSTEVTKTEEKPAGSQWEEAAVRGQEKQFLPSWG
ncbi:MAG: hypothetical protein RLO18_32230, partial [Gimesia chilikensis]